MEELNKILISTIQELNDIFIYHFKNKRWRQFRVTMALKSFRHYITAPIKSRDIFTPNDLYDFILYLNTAHKSGFIDKHCGYNSFTFPSSEEIMLSINDENPVATSLKSTVDDGSNGGQIATFTFIPIMTKENSVIRIILTLENPWFDGKRMQNTMSTYTCEIEYADSKYVSNCKSTTDIICSSAFDTLKNIFTMFNIEVLEGLKEKYYES